MNTVISAASAGLLIGMINQFQNVFVDEQLVNDRQIQYQYNVHMLCNGVLAGMVSVTSSCNNIELYAAGIIGSVGGLIYIQTKKIVQRFEIDDPLDISEVHGFCGIWSVIAVGIFDKDKGFFSTGNAD